MAAKDGRGGAAALLVPKNGIVARTNAVAVGDGPERGWLVGAVTNADGGVVERWRLEDGRRMKRVHPAGAAAVEARTRGRMAKALWRGVAYALGVGAARSCVTGTARTPAGLDLLPPMPAPDTLNRMMDAAAARGAGLLSFASYRTACEEGWAPTPTNDVQKAIWDEVRSGRRREEAKAAETAP